MQFKRFLIVLLSLSGVVFLFYVIRVVFLVPGAVDILKQPKFLIFAIIPIIIILFGHLLRAYKAKLLLGPVKESGLKTQYQALLIGYLFNTILPFRLGELVRAQVLGRSIKISASFIFSLILLERAIDGIILGLLGVTLWLHGGIESLRIAQFSFVLLLVSLLLISLLYLLYQQNSRLLKGWHRFTSLFNERLKNSLRFKLWSVIYGLQKLLKPKLLIRYVAQSVLMWAVYLAGLTLLASFFFHTGLVSNILRSFISYLGVSIPSGPAYLGAYQAVTNSSLQALSKGSISVNFLIASWFVLTIPSSVFGAFLLFRHKTDYSKLLKVSDKERLRNKLERIEDTSQELAAFLDSYFSSNTLSHILHKLEIRSNINLIKYFKGGSNASTILVHQDGDYKVKKITPIQYSHRLKAQHAWLKQYAGLDKIVNITGESERPDFYSIDIEYHADLIPFFDYIHSNDIGRSKDILTNVFDYLFENVYKPEPLKTDYKTLEEYINNKIYQKLGQASKLNDELALLREYETLQINGREYLNIDKVLDKIHKNKQIWQEIATFSKSPIHGDVQVDNILASIKDHSFMIIDPVDQNEVSSPVVDFARMFQSLNYGYEFLCRDDAPVPATGNSIAYEDSVSAAYRELYEHFKTVAQRLLSPGEYRSILFHTAVHYIRMSTHRVEINPNNVAKFYAVSVRAFNDFLAQYE